jgi:Arc/MetJ-type ribon-helix-helix transcriptional regulator
MGSSLSPENEAFIRSAIADGLYPSRKALLNAAVDALRLPDSRDERLQAALQAGIDDIATGRAEEWNADDATRRYRERLAERKKLSGAASQRSDDDMPSLEQIEAVTDGPYTNWRNDGSCSVDPHDSPP